MQVFSFIILILSVIIHEVSHGYAALYLGDPTAKYEGRLTLNPVKHIDPVGSILVPIITSFAGMTFGWAKPVPFNPYNLRNKRWGEAIVAAAGPLSNIVIAIVFGLFIRWSIAHEAFSESTITLAMIIVLINITLALFNLVPVPPLDGSKILFAIIPERFAGFRRNVEGYGMVLVLVLVFLVWPHISGFVGKLFTILTGIEF